MKTSTRIFAVFCGMACILTGLLIDDAVSRADAVRYGLLGILMMATVYCLMRQLGKENNES